MLNSIWCIQVIIANILLEWNWKLIFVSNLNISGLKETKHIVSVKKKNSNVLINDLVLTYYMLYRKHMSA